jgi:hypothetical protein
MSAVFKKAKTDGSWASSAASILDHLVRSDCWNIVNASPGAYLSRCIDEYIQRNYTQALCNTAVWRMLSEIVRLQADPKGSIGMSLDVIQHHARTTHVFSGSTFENLLNFISDIGHKVDTYPKYSARLDKILRDMQARATTSTNKLAFKGLKRLRENG